MQFETVINLCQQMRMTDETWIGILQRAREGDCSELDIQEIRKLILTNPNCDVPDFDNPPWNNAVLVTPRNSVRAAWNRAALRKHCAKTGNILYIVDAEDTVGDNRQNGI